ncbi:sulfur carrier protein ThiS adenylyltransferase [Anaerosolibacter carboniphilus]|uniref:Sulfur carrier protein ThiS adenylyltransferase n=1 Tax=Anaerosolibacter carboniphilus TaxID=1417629 RepID=A0A841L265_9FIRM|nr:sulfur carrier protein ThiS adenylyltransferase ThiF [Anaerosolibacter carboniphilus]MBB6217252.1 sulfur carrier protein ThiS adenylyltransferase [Anaerosolibacter carboniphilus]
MNLFEEALLSHMGKENLEKVQNCKVGIAGAGGLGSNCAFNLVRSGFKHFVMADFDVVEFTNLNRQFYFAKHVGRKKVDALKENLLHINCDLWIETYREKIESHNVGDVFKDCDVVVEAFDKAQYKRMIVEHYLNSEKLLVSASGLAGWGKSDAIQVHRMKERFYLVGDLETEVGEDVPPMSPRVNIAAAKQADVVLAYVLGENPYVKG